MKTMTVKLPDQVTDVDEKEVRMIVAAKLFEQGKLSSGRAAEVAGITKREFIETVGEYGISIFGQLTIEDVKNDLANARVASDGNPGTSHLER
jgi:Uncharacterized small protein